MSPGNAAGILISVTKTKTLNESIQVANGKAAYTKKIFEILDQGLCRTNGTISFL